MVLREALIDLIEEKGFDAVTVGDIAERAMVNRTTFYRHYPDKYALVTGIFEEAVNQMFREIGPLPENVEGLLSSESTFDAEAVQLYIDSQLAAWSAFFEHVTRHARLYRVMLGKRGSSWFAIQMRDYFAQAIRQRARTLSASGLRATNDPNAAPAEFVIISLAYLLLWWAAAYRRSESLLAGRAGSDAAALTTTVYSRAPAASSCVTISATVDAFWPMAT